MRGLSELESSIQKFFDDNHEVNEHTVDFSRFKDKLEHAAKLNKTSKIIQLTKLRDCLSGYPLSIVPETARILVKPLMCSLNSLEM